MNRIHIITALMLLLFSFSLRAEDDKVRFAYDVDFEMRFDNREYYRSAFARAGYIPEQRYVPQTDGGN